LLDGFGSDEIKIGLKKAARLDWPPSIGEFMKLCRQEENLINPQAYRILEHPPYRAIVDFDVNSIAAKSNMRKTKKITGIDWEVYDDETETKILEYDTEQAINESSDGE